MYWYEVNCEAKVSGLCFTSKAYTKIVCFLKKDQLELIRSRRCVFSTIYTPSVEIILTKGIVHLVLGFCNWVCSSCFPGPLWRLCEPSRDFGC